MSDASIIKPRCSKREVEKIEDHFVLKFMCGVARQARKFLPTFQRSYIPFQDEFRESFRCV